jgi:hypothetical protein
MLKAVIVVLVVGLFAFCVNAQDANVTLQQLHEEMQTLQQLTAQLNKQLQEPHVQVVTAQFDAQSLQILQQLGDKMAILEQKQSLIEERFAALRTDLSNKSDESKIAVINELTTKINAVVGDSAESTKQYMKDMTNPIRINLPNFGLWLMVTAAFMLVAGMRFKTALRDAEREIKQTKTEARENVREKEAGNSNNIGCGASSIRRVETAGSKTTGYKKRIAAIKKQYSY